MNNFINKNNFNLDELVNMVVNTKGVIIGGNADDDNLDDMCIFVADSRPVKYLKCSIVDNKKVYTISDMEIKRIDDEIAEEVR